MRVGPSGEKWLTQVGSRVSGGTPASMDRRTVRFRPQLDLSGWVAWRLGVDKRAFLVERNGEKPGLVPMHGLI